MIFWRKKNNPTVQERQDKEDRIIHHPSEPALSPLTVDDGLGPHDKMALEIYEHELYAAGSSDIEALLDLPDLPPLPPVPSQPDLPPPSSAPEADPVVKSDPVQTTPEISEQVVQPPAATVLFTDPLADAPPPVPVETADGGGWLSRLSAGLTKSTFKIGQGLTDFVTKTKLDAATLEKLEEVLITADLGPVTAAKVIKQIADQKIDRDVTEGEIRELLAREIETILSPCAKPLVVKRPSHGPFVILVCGVNGVGKTTTIGKMAKIMHDHKHHKVMMVAGDTFRAAAVEQLQIWGTRAHSPVVTRDIGADAAALAFEAYDQAVRDHIEVMMMDTAGRLHNKANLMAELEKIVRVIKKHGDDLPHEVVLVLDGTTGQNAFAQVETFKSMVNVTGLIVTKLDGSAKGGVVVGLADKFRLPIYAVGVGEGVDDLQPFTAEGYARALVGLT